MQQVAKRTLVILGALLYLGTGWLYLGAGLLVPAMVTPLLWAIWLAGVWLIGRQVREWSLWTLAGAPAAVLIWIGFISIGDWLFGWTA